MIKLTGGGASTAHPLQANIAIRRLGPSSWILSLVTIYDGISGERTLSARSCESLTEAATLTLALILNPKLASASAPVSASASESVEETSPPSRGVTVASAEDHTFQPVWTVSAQAGVLAGVLGEASPSFALSLGVAVGRVSLRLVANVTPSQDVFIAAEREVGGRLWAAGVSGLGCWGAASGRLRPNACLGVDGTRLDGHGLGVLRPRDAQVYWSSLELGGLVGFRPARNLLFELGAMGLLALGRPAFYLEGIGQLSRPATFGIKAFGGLAWIFE